MQNLLIETPGELQKTIVLSSPTILDESLQAGDHLVITERRFCRPARRAEHILLTRATRTSKIWFTTSTARAFLRVRSVMA